MSKKKTFTKNMWKEPVWVGEGGDPMDESSCTNNCGSFLVRGGETKNIIIIIILYEPNGSSFRKKRPVSYFTSKIKKRWVPFHFLRDPSGKWVVTSNGEKWVSCPIPTHSHMTTTPLSFLPNSLNTFLALLSSPKAFVSCCSLSRYHFVPLCHIKPITHSHFLQKQRHTHTPFTFCNSTNPAFYTPLLFSIMGHVTCLSSSFFSGVSRAFRLFSPFFCYRFSSRETGAPLLAYLIHGTSWNIVRHMSFFLFPSKQVPRTIKGTRDQLQDPINSKPLLSSTVYSSS
ncbi:LAFA_0A02102g1_1 [Lachancea sp. 'fantastica']|nr:LAFA_0A02102g1_1 [Lachancea sp. 'fantastica']